MSRLGQYNNLNMKVLVVVVSYKDEGICINDICQALADVGDDASEKQVRYHLNNWIDKGMVLDPREEKREGYHKGTLFYYPSKKGCRMVGVYAF